MTNDLVSVPDKKVGDADSKSLFNGPRVVGFCWCEYDLLP